MSIRARFVPLVLAAACGGRATVQSPPATSLAIVGVTVVHPATGPTTREKADADQTVLISGDRIVAVGPRDATPPPSGARIIDGRGRWLIPGLIDAHVHFFQSGNPFTRPDVVDFNDVVPYAQEVARNKARLAVTFKVWLACGVTSVVDTGGPMWNFEVRDQSRRSASAPRVLVAGPLVSLVDRKALELDDPPIIKVSTADEARALVARELTHQPDFIKVWFIHLPGADLARDEAIVRAAGDAAHAGGVRLLVHATELDTAKAALRAGADVLVHSVFDVAVDDELLRLARERHAILVPTLWVMVGYRITLAGKFEPTSEERRLADPQILAALRAVPRPNPALPPGLPSPTALENLRRMWAAGIPVALGTDAGNIGTVHGPSVFREARLMLEAGLTPGDVLYAATVNGAKVLGMEKDLGDVAAGKLADLVLLDADPLASVDNLARARLVIRAGRVFVPDELISSIR